jgi:hypothetical protein
MRVREIATVTPESPVSGANTRKRSGGNRRMATPVETVTVHPDVMAAARRVMRPGQRLVIVSATRVRLVNA